ncbi:MAG: hypothetical protein QOH21_1043 [Acidobacteriota bacterium]|jgi:MoxR-like ATPase|nr:hypothetical protein [Acidobacteriota bacterium]
MNYKKIFNPRTLPTAAVGELGDRSDGARYVFNDEITLAVNVALATRRPLLVRGTTGCGKSSLAPSVAAHLKFRYLETVISSRTEAEHLLWHVDHLRRLRDAQANQLAVMDEYVLPGVLWWALDPLSAEAQWKRAGGGARYEQRTGVPPKKANAVVLLDEIDKADPDLPNNLLVPLGSLAFHVAATAAFIAADEHNAPLVVITSNDERDLPAAFLRRCVELKIEPPDAPALLTIAARHFPDLDSKLREKVLARIIETRPPDWKGRSLPVAAEYLDALRAADKLGAKKTESVLDDIARLVVWKPSQNVTS